MEIVTTGCGLASPPDSQHSDGSHKLTACDGGGCGWVNFGDGEGGNSSGTWLLSQGCHQWLGRVRMKKWQLIVCERAKMEEMLKAQPLSLRSPTVPHDSERFASSHIVLFPLALFPWRCNTLNISHGYKIWTATASSRTSQSWEQPRVLKYSLTCLHECLSTGKQKMPGMLCK